jgi:hypothetical protein
MAIGLGVQTFRNSAIEMIIGACSTAQISNFFAKVFVMPRGVDGRRITSWEKYV